MFRVFYPSLFLLCCFSLLLPSPLCSPHPRFLAPLPCPLSFPSTPPAIVGFPPHFDPKGWACGTLLHITYASLWLEQVFASSSSACHFIAMVSFPRIVTPQANQIDMLIRILLARSILDLAEDIPESLSTSSCDLLFSGIPQPTGGLHLSAVLDAMGGRLQSWPTSPLVVLAKQCLEVAPNPDVWAVNLYLIIFLGIAGLAFIWCHSLICAWAPCQVGPLLAWFFSTSSPAGF